MTSRPDPRIRWIAPIALLAIAIIAYFWFRPKPHGMGTAYVSAKSVTLWTSTAEVRQQVVTLHYGDKVTVLAQQGPVDQVRSAAGEIGWMDVTGLMDPALWQQATALLVRAQTMEVQATGYAKTVTNVRIEPGRSAQRIYQFARDVPVVILSRAVADAPQADATGGDQSNSAAPAQSAPKAEDWLLVMRDESAAPIAIPAESAAASVVTSAATPATTSDPSEPQAAPAPAAEAAPPMAGWVLARFIELSPPGPVRDNALSSDLHVVAWFELNRVPGGSGEMPQYLVAGSRGEEGQPCDFTLLRVYTWDDPRQRYETAFLESDLCGKLPIHVSQSLSGPQFKFAEASGAGSERVYAMNHTMVRLIEPAPKNSRAPRHSAHSAK